MLPVLFVPGDAVVFGGVFFGSAVFAAFGDPVFYITGHIAIVFDAVFFHLDTDLFGCGCRRRNWFRIGLDDLDYALFH